MASLLVEADDLPDGLLVAGADARVELVNAAAERVLGRRAADLLGRDIRTAVPLQDTTGRDWWECTDPWGPGPAIRTGHRERLLIAPPAREVLVAARYVRERRSGPVVRVAVQLHDTEARRRAESDHAGLISTVAHELRSPLTSVKGFTSTLLRRWDRFTDEQKILMLTTVEADADRVTRLISELLDVSRIDAGRLEVRRQPVDVVQAVYAHVDRMVAAGHEPGRFVVLESGPRPEVWADPDRVDQVLGNLVENAVRHGAGTVTVTVEPYRTGAPRPPAGSAGSTGPAGTAGPEGAAGPDGVATWREAGPDGEDVGVAVTVEDEGEGIPQAHLPLVFTKFWRGSRRGGTGLGLYVVRGLVQAHGGRITVGRSAAGGARFAFTLPAARPEHLD